MDKVTRQDVLDAMAQAQTRFTRYMRGMESQLVEAELAQAENPGLRHGDYGYGPAGAWIRVHGSTWWDTKDCSGPSEQDADVFIPYRLGNILDDLNELAKPLEEFTLAELSCKLLSTGDISILCIASNTLHYIPARDRDKFIMQLRRMANTAERATDGND